MITLPLPPSSNRYWRNFRGMMVKSAEARAYQMEVRGILTVEGVEINETEPVCVTMRVYRARKSGDLDNRIKVVLDALNGIAWKDDSQVVEIHAFRYDDKNCPRVEINIDVIVAKMGDQYVKETK